MTSKRLRDFLQDVLISILFAIVWAFVSIMSEEIIHDDLDQRPNLLITVTDFYWRLTTYVLPLAIIVLIWSRKLIMPLVNNQIYLSLLVVVFGEWIYLSLALPQIVLNSSVNRLSQRPFIYRHTIQISDLWPLLAFNILLIMIGLYVYITRRSKQITSHNNI